MERSNGDVGSIQASAHRMILSSGLWLRRSLVPRIWLPLVPWQYCMHGWAKRIQPNEKWHCLFPVRISVTICAKDEGIYSGIANNAEATTHDNALQSDEYFQDGGASVLLKSGFGSTTISFVVQDGVFGTFPSGSPVVALDSLKRGFQ
jgi:hypothetical protein